MIHRERDWWENLNRLNIKQAWSTEGTERRHTHSGRRLVRMWLKPPSWFLHGIARLYWGSFQFAEFPNNPGITVSPEGIFIIAFSVLMDIYLKRNLKIPRITQETFYQDPKGPLLIARGLTRTPLVSGSHGPRKNGTEAGERLEEGDGAMGSPQALELDRDLGQRRIAPIMSCATLGTEIFLNLSFRFFTCKMGRSAFICFAILWVRIFGNVMCCLNIKKNYVKQIHMFWY